jgi:phosphatidylglycerophosphate synthase
MVNKLADHYECPSDKYLCKFIDNHLHIYYNFGFTPNMVTTLSILVGLLTAYEILQGNYGAASILWLMSYYFDCVDGKLARRYNMVTQFGDLYDHIGDAFKYFVVIYSLFYSTKKRTTDKQWLYLAIILILMVLSFVHMGYQERVYDKKDESEYLNICKIFTLLDNDPHRTIQYTKYLGCGNWMLCFALLIFIWRK